MHKYYGTPGAICNGNVNRLYRRTIRILWRLFQSVQRISEAYIWHQASSNHFGWKFIRRISECYRRLYTKSNIQMRTDQVHIFAYVFFSCDNSNLIYEFFLCLSSRFRRSARFKIILCYLFIFADIWSIICYSSIRLYYCGIGLLSDL